MSLAELPPLVWQSSLIVLFACLLLFIDAPKMRRLKQFTSSAGRLSAVRSAILTLWGCATVALLLAGPNELFVVPQVGADMAWLHGNPVVMALSIVILAIWFSLLFLPGLHCAIRPEARRKYWGAVQSLLHLLPVSDRERRWWVLVSITAGVCEELLFRGFLHQFLQGQLHGNWTLNLTSAWLLSALAFGLSHFYQGVAGIARTALTGAMFGLLAIVSGNLLLPIVLHVLVDLAVLWVYRPQLDHPATAARLMQGCSPALVSKA